LSEEALALKRILYASLIKMMYVPTVYVLPLKWGLKQDCLAPSLFEEKKMSRIINERLDRYDILYTIDFNPNSKDVVLFRSNLDKEKSGIYLFSLCKYFTISRARIQAYCTIFTGRMKKP
jgi:hypothetical protein